MIRSFRVTPLPLVLALVLLVACGGTENPAAIAPAPPSDVTATPGPGYITVSWTDESDDEDGFVVYRIPSTDGLGPQQAAERVGEVGANVTTFNDHGVPVGMTFGYEVVATNDGAESAPSATDSDALIERGIELMVGTVNRPGDVPHGTAILAYYVFPPEELVGQDVTLIVTGPPGWRGDDPLVYPETEAGLEHRWRSTSRLTTEAVAGTYQAEVTIGGITYTTSAELASTEYTLPTPSNIMPLAVSEGEITATWDAPADARSYLTALWTGDFGSLVVPYAPTEQTTATLADLELAPGSYRFEVVAYNTDFTQPIPPKVEPYGVSYDSSEPFDVGSVEIGGT